MRTFLRSGRVRLIVGALAAAAALLVALVHAPPVRSRVLAIVASRIAASGLVVRADALDYNLFTRTVRLSGVSVATPGAAGTPFLTAKDVRASLPWAVIAGRAAIEGSPSRSYRRASRCIATRSGTTTGHSLNPIGRPAR